MGYINEIDKNVKTGDIVVFGAYPQTSGGLSRVPIKWRVLEKS
jgi:hypothetical protein